MKEVGVGILGFGTVGAGVVDILQRNGTLLTERAGVQMVLRRIADLDLETDRGVTVDPALLTTDAEQVIRDPAVQIVVELIGGTTVAGRFTREALQQGKAVVTANKALLAEQGRALYPLAAQHKADLLFEASVGGGIPIIRALREGLVANHIQQISGILNGTCNYILTRMEQEKCPFDQVLSEAQAAGYAEAEPGLDIDGFDTAHKTVVLAMQGFGCDVGMDDVQVEGIRGIDPMDIEYAASLGYRIKLMAVIRREGDMLELRVHPTLIPRTHLMADVHGVFNAVWVKGDHVGDTLYYGRGAGREPTASAVVSDIVDAARSLAVQAPPRVPAFSALSDAPRIKPIEEGRSRCYLRLSLKDEPGVFAKVATILGRHGISIASVIQQESRSGAYVPVVILTHDAMEGAYRTALQEMDALDEVGATAVRYRIEDFN